MGIYNKNIRLLVMKIFSYTPSKLIIIYILISSLNAQHRYEYNLPKVSLETKPICKKVYIGVNWHMGSKGSCWEELYQSGYIFGNSAYPTVHKARVFILNNKSDLSDIFYNNKICMLPFELLELNYNCYTCGNPQLSKLHDKLNETSFFWYKLLPLLDYDTYDYYENDKIDALNNYAIHKLPNYYRLPYSSDWDSLQKAYSSTIINKLFYVAIYKCKLCYIPNGEMITIAVPNLHLDLKSTDPEKRALCEFQELPVSVITRITDIKRIKPYNKSR
jgi:hypothetical protein